MLYFAHSVISDHITIDNYYYLLLLCKAQMKTKNKTKQQNKTQNKIENNEFKKSALKIVKVIISMT